MPARSRGGGSIGVVGSGRATSDVLQVGVHIEGIDRATEAMRRVRREINNRLRDAQQEIGERLVLPAVKDAFPRKSADVTRGLPVGAMADSLYVKRDRQDVVIGSRLRGKENRALGWIDFGGRHGGVYREGSHVILGTLDEKQGAITGAITDAVLKAFSTDFDVTG